MSMGHLTFLPMLVALMLFAGSVHAETVFPVHGGKGDRTEQYRCPKGEVILGFHGKTGNWVDHIGLTCGRFVAPSYTLAAMKRWSGRGGAGGAPNAKDCDLNAAIRNITVATLRDSYVFGIEFSCARPVSGRQAGGGVFAGNYPFWEHRNFPDFTKPGAPVDPSSPRRWGAQECPGVEYATGLTIRYGTHVNAVGLICGALIAEGNPAKEWLPGAENMIDRPGSDFESFPVASSEPAQCRVACLSHDTKCAAWTYVKPGIQGSDAMCHLKNAVPATVRDRCCISGVHPKFDMPSDDRPRTGPNEGDVTREPDGGLAPASPGSGGAAQREDGGIAGEPTSAGCSRPFVQRKARPGDAVCVTRDSFATVQQENASAPSRWDPSGAYGPNTCTSGYVWREAFDGDTVCVTPARRAEVKEENRLAPTRAAARERPFQPSRTSPGALEDGG